MAKITKILLVSGMPQRSRITVSKKKKNAIEVLSMCLAWVKRYFEENQLTAFFFMAQITQILLFSGMPILQRSQFEHIRFFFFFLSKKFFL